MILLFHQPEALKMCIAIYRIFIAYQMSDMRKQGRWIGRNFNFDEYQITDLKLASIVREVAIKCLFTFLLIII